MEFVKLPRLDSETCTSPATNDPAPAEIAFEQPTRVWDLCTQPSLWSLTALKRLFHKK